MIDFSPCKINIGLEIVAKRADGYHDLETVFYPVSLHDIIELNSNKEPVFEYTQSGFVVDSSIENNLLYKAWRIIDQAYGVGGVKVHLHKQIPMGAGLGGGSANAAVMLKMLNSYCSLGIPKFTLQEMAASLGADCPFFIESKPVYAYDIGTCFKEISLSLEDYYIVLVKPDIHVSTQEAYGGVKPQTSDFDLRKLHELAIEDWQGKVKNRFECHIFEHHPLLKGIKEQLLNLGAVYSAMSGSGSAIYGLFKEQPKEINFDSSCFVWSGRLS